MQCLSGKFGLAWSSLRGNEHQRASSVLEMYLELGSNQFCLACCGVRESSARGLDPPGRELVLCWGAERPVVALGLALPACVLASLLKLHICQ